MQVWYKENWVKNDKPDFKIDSATSSLCNFMQTTSFS